MGSAGIMRLVFCLRPPNRPQSVIWGSDRPV